MAQDTNCTEVVNQLQGKVKEYEEILETLLDEKKPVLGILKSDSFKEGGKAYYRCEVDGTDVLAMYKKSFMFDKSDLKIGKEVVLVAGTIIGIVPKELEAPKQKNTFQLISWNEIRGLKSQLERIKEAVQTPLKHPKVVKEFGLEPIKGMVLWGAPGCGKTLIAKAIASEILSSSEADDEAFHYYKGGEMLRGIVGQAEQEIVGIFKRARKYSVKTGSRAIIFIDEAEAILPRRGSKISSDVETTIVPTFLSEMDGFDDVVNSPFILLATNYPHQLDDAVMREGRIDIKIEITRPTKEDAVDIFNLYLSKVKVAEDIDVLANGAADKIFKSPAKERISGSMLKTIVNNATSRAVARFVECGGKCKEKGVILDDIHYSINNLN
jgi:SpoVK/Ycf46/Vps4 family AAA+-type ATPase